MRLTLLLLAIGTAMLLTVQAGPARADVVDRALARLCPRGAAGLAPGVRAASRRYLLPPVLLVALMRAESGCLADVVNPTTGAVGLGQILPAGNANPRHLTTWQLQDPARNLELTARHLARCLSLCGSLGGAVSVYGGHRTCRESRHSRRVLSFVAEFWAWAGSRVLTGAAS